MTDNAPLPRLVTYGSGIDYADGSEKELLKIVADPGFSEATAWRDAKGWAQYYHLSPLRRNLLAWMRFDGRPLRILELGAGCGAITSWLVTVPSVHVVTVEGTLDRAKVIQARCAQAANLEIHACPIDKYVPDAPFDIVTLIGVLEYAGKYETGEDPFATLLNRASGWLKDDGIIVVAIENQLGVKYLSGTAEDHYGVAFEGVNGYPHYNGVRTFTTETLSHGLRLAGFAEQWWYYPYPDYKLPSVVFSRDALDNVNFDWTGLVDIPTEPNENGKPAFSDRTFLKLSHENGVMHHFMNSFLVIGAKRQECLFARPDNLAMTAIKTNVKFRGTPFQTVTLFSGSDEQVQVEKKRLNDQPYPGAEKIRHTVSLVPEPYHPHTINLFDAIVDAVAMCDTVRVAAYCRLWEDLLQSHVVPSTPPHVNDFRSFMLNSFDRVLYEGSLGGAWLPGRFLDLIPLNIVFDPLRPISTDTAGIIDLEWQCVCDVPLQLVFDRGYNLMIGKLQRYFQPHKLTLHPESGLPMSVHEAVSALEFSRECNLLHCRIFETWFQAGVGAGSFDLHLDWATIVPQLEARLAQKPISLSLEQFIETVVQMVEKGNNRDAVAFFDKYRKHFSAEPQIREFEKVIEGMRQRLMR